MSIKTTTAIEEERYATREPIPDKIETARSYDSFRRVRRPKPIPERDARRDDREVVVLDSLEDKPFNAENDFLDGEETDANSMDVLVPNRAAKRDAKRDAGRDAPQDDGKKRPTRGKGLLEKQYTRKNVPRDARQDPPQDDGKERATSKDSLLDVEETYLDMQADKHDGGFLDIVTDEEDGLLAMFKAIRDLIFPERAARDGTTTTGRDANAKETDRDNSEPEEKQERMPEWQRETVDQFLRVWHHVEVSEAARVLVTDEEDSVLAMCREVGNATFDEVAAGSRVLSRVVLENMRTALGAAQNLSQRAMLMATDAMEPEGACQTVHERNVGDVSMGAMFHPEEWS